MEVTILGCGSIGTTLAAALQDDPQISVLHLCDSDHEKARELADSLEKGVPCSDWRTVNADLLVECASVKTAVSAIPEALRRGMDVVVLSVGSLVEPGFLEKVERISRDTGARLYVPSGAVGSIDALSAARIAGLDRVKLTTVKNPRGFIGSEYLRKKGIDPERIDTRTIIFSGSALEAARAFPRNINVAATIGLAGIGLGSTEVEIIADPSTDINSHTITAEGRFGRFRSTFENRPHPDNGKTSMLAALSAINAVKRLNDSVVFGA